MKKLMTSVFLLLFATLCFTQAANNTIGAEGKKTIDRNLEMATKQKFIATVEMLDAANSSFNSLNSILKKEGYWLKITSLNNPTSSGMGFSLQNVVQSAVKPLLEKAKTVNIQKFNGIISSMLATSSQSTFGKSLSLVNPVFPTILSLVGNLTIQEKKITKEDLDSFVANTSRYFMQYEKLNSVNFILDQNIDRLNSRMQELQFDLREFMVNVTSALFKDIQRSSLKMMNAEDMFLKYLNRPMIEIIFEKAGKFDSQFPSDALKTAKDIAYGLQKIFNEYQKTYSANHQQIKAILLEAKKLGKDIMAEQIDASIKEVEDLYNQSSNSDILSLRLTTLFQRLDQMISMEQQVVKINH